MTAARSRGQNQHFSLLHCTMPALRISSHHGNTPVQASGFPLAAALGAAEPQAVFYASQPRTRCQNPFGMVSRAPVMVT
jgi:hypothetical protein